MKIFVILLLTLSFPNARTDDFRFDVKYKRYGIGVPLVLINGGPGRSSKSFKSLAEKISKLGFQVILFDQRGTGESLLSSISEKTISLSLMVEDLDRLRKKLNLSKLNILGHSFGGLYAMAYTSKYPNKVNSLILSASPSADLKWMNNTKKNMLSRLNSSQKDHYHFWNSKKQKEENFKKSKIESLRALLPAYVYQQRFISLLEEKLLKPEPSYFKINTLMWKNLKQIEFDVKSSLKKFMGKVLIIGGDEDFFDITVRNSLSKTFQSNRVVTLKKCRHYPWLDQPDQYFKEIKKHLNYSY